MPNDLTPEDSEAPSSKHPATYDFSGCGCLLIFMALFFFSPIVAILNAIAEWISRQ